MKHCALPCIDCVVDLSMDNVDAAELWQDMAMRCTRESPYVYLENALHPNQIAVLQQDLRMMELRGYIVSYEHGKDGWMIRILGFRPGNPMICVHRHRK